LEIKIKKSKTYSGWCPSKGLSNDTTLRLIQSGRTAGTFKCSVAGDTVTIGRTTARRQESTLGGKVPETLFYDTPQNLAVMEAMLQDFLLGEHLLLVGNQAIPLYI
jgi:hypothetical protein